jgi:hypothetical protein
LIAKNALSHIIGMLAQKSDLQILSAKLLGILCVNGKLLLIGPRTAIINFILRRAQSTHWFQLHFYADITAQCARRRSQKRDSTHTTRHVATRV